MHGDTILLATRKGLIRMRRGARRWEIERVSHEGVPVAYAERDARDGRTWACLDHGHWGQKLSRSEDDGATWEEVAAPTYPEDAVVMDGFPGAETRRTQPATLKYLWVFAPGGADRPGRIYLGTEPGGLFRSDDGGESFELVHALWDHPSRLEGWFGGGRDQAGIHSVLVDPRDSSRVLVGVSCAGVFETTDDGATWAPRNVGLSAEFLPDPAAEVGQDPHCVAWCPADPDRVWQQNHCGIYKSTDGAATWTQVSKPEGPAHFGFPVAVDEARPDTAWVVPGHSDQRRMAIGGGLCVCRTEDGGESWQELREGLPQEGAFDVVYRHALDLAGDRLAFGSTTGNAYVSDDRGESWRCLGNNLPPIYGVRFAE